jgi:hypothetical protein
VDRLCDSLSGSLRCSPADFGVGSDRGPRDGWCNGSTFQVIPSNFLLATGRLLAEARIKTVEQERDTARSCQLVCHRRYRPAGHETCGTVLPYVVGTEVGLPWCMRAR